MLRDLAEVGVAMWPKFLSSILANVALGGAVGAFSLANLQAADAPKAPAKAASKTPAKPTPGAPAAKPAPPPESLVKKPESKSYDLTRAQQERMQKYLPKAYPKLAHRDAFHVVVIGDEILGMAGRNEDSGNMLKAWPVQFLNEISSQFLYTGGVRLIKPAAGKPAKEQAQQMGPEITVRGLPRDEGLMTQAMQTLTTYGFENPPDLVIISFGVHDSESSQDLGTYARALQQVIETVRAKGADLILVGPTLTAGSAGINSLGSTRAFSSTMREAADSAGILFADPGDLNPLVKLDPKTLEPEHLYDDVLKQYRRFFISTGGEDNLHPTAELHRLVGRQMFEIATDGAQAAPWKLTAGSATFDKAGHFSLTTEIENPGKTPLTLIASALETARWKSSGTLPKIELKPGAKQAITLQYDLVSGEGSSSIPSFPSHEPFLRLPLLISTGTFTQVAEVHAEIKPLALLWKLDTQFNQKGSFLLDNVLVNTTGAALKAVKWSAEWSGQKKSGSLDLAAGATGELPLKFDMPQMSVKDPLPVKVEVTANGATLHWERSIEYTPNIGLKQELHLVPLGETKARVRLRADADPTSLFLIFDMTGVELESSPDGTAIQLEVSLDARSYGKRLAFGAVEPLLIRCGAADGAGVAAKIAPWAFGTGYGMVYDPKYVRCQLNSGSNGARRLTVTLPRAYLYLHEWALGNGNSELGINTRLSFWHNGGFKPESTFSITNNLRPDTDAEGLATLELTDEPTSRWTVVIW